MGAHEYDVLLAGPGLKGEAVVAMADKLREHTFEIQEQFWLFEPAAVRLHGRRTEPVGDELRSRLMDEAETGGLDAFVLEAKRPRPRLMVFDMDSTLIEAEIIDELAGLAGVKERVSAITERAMRGEINFRGALAERLALLKGLPEARLQELLRSVGLSQGLEQLMTVLKARGVKTAIVSGGFGFFGRELKRRLSFDHLVCNELEIVDGLLTGRAGAEIVDADRKKASLERIAKEEGIALDEVVAVGDGANDLPMMRAAGIGVAYRAKPVVKAAAQYRLSCGNLDCLVHLV